MSKKHIPIRMCVICRERFPKQDLARFVCLGRQSRGVVYDRANILPGRGFYVCTKEACGEKFSKSRGRRDRMQGDEHG